MADSEYTPTDEEVRIKYVLTSGVGDEGRAEFDRWLSARDARVRAEERERCAVAVEKAVEYIDKCIDELSNVDPWTLKLMLRPIRALPSTPETGETK